GGESGIVLVHGDTFSTLIGAIMGRIAKLKVGHVESGLRSFNIFHPFPEELTRLATFRLSDVMFCPGDWAVENLKAYSGKKINIHANTLFDALCMAKNFPTPSNLSIPSCEFGIVTLHRFENLHAKSTLLKLINIVEYIALTQQLLFILHKPTDHQVNKYGLYDRDRRHANMDLRPSVAYGGFRKL